MVRENAASEHDRVSAGEAVITDLDRLGRLSAGTEIDAVGEQLRAKAGDGGEGANADPRRAIDQMPAADACMPFQNKLRAPVGLMSEMTARAAGKTGDPIELADDGVRAEMK